ncbi:MAG: hypothetical protein MHPSP_002394, partial [Paramarteilia canceri]
MIAKSVTKSISIPNDNESHSATFFDHFHGEIILEDCTKHVYYTKPVQRLREISQLSFERIIQPSASHSRLTHSIG